MRTLSSLLLLALPLAAGAVPMELQTQGRLLNALGAPLDGDHSVTVTIYDSPASGTVVWTEDFPVVSFVDGYYNLDFGQTSGNEFDGTDFASDDLYLSFAVDSAPEIPDRLRLRSVPFAIRADTADTASNVVGGIVDVTEVRINGTTIIDSSGIGNSPMDWSNVTGAPAVIGDLTCTDGQIAVMASGAWACDAANNHAHAGIPWSSIDGSTLPAGLADGDDVLDKAAITGMGFAEGSGTSGYLASFSSTGTLEDSPLYQVGGDVTLGTTTVRQALTVRGGAYFETSTNGTPLTVARNMNNNEKMEIGLDDATAHFVYTNDEVSNRVRFRFVNTDTESGGGAGASDVTTMMVGSSAGNGYVNVNGTIDSTGYITPKAPITIYEDPAAGTATNAAAAFNVGWDVNVRGDGDLVTKSASRNVFRMNRAGWYEVNFRFLLSSVNANTVYRVQVYKNTTRYKELERFGPDATPDDYHSVIETLYINSDGNDDFRIRLYSDSGDAFAMHASPGYSQLVFKYVGD